MTPHSKSLNVERLSSLAPLHRTANPRSLERKRPTCADLAEDEVRLASHGNDMMRVVGQLDIIMNAFALTFAAQ